MLNTKISRQKLKISKFFNSQKEFPKYLSKNKYSSAGLSPERKTKNSILLTELKTEHNDINNYLTFNKLNIKKKLRQNKTENNYTNIKSQLNNENKNNNKMGKTFYKLNTPINKVKSLSDITNLIKPNYSNRMTQTSISFFNSNNKEENNFSKLKKIQRIKNLELNDSFNDKKSNNITYIDYHLNNILAKKKENNKLNRNNGIKLFINNKNNISGLMLRLNNTNNNGIKNYYEKNGINSNNKRKLKIEHNKTNIDNTNNNKFHINQIYFENELDNLLHKIIVIKNSKNELDNLVMSLTNDELKLLYENKNILPILIKNRSNNKLTENEKFYQKDDKKINGLKNVSFENNLINLFIKSNKKPIIKKDFPKIQFNENDKNNNSSVNYDHIKYQNNLKTETNKSSLSKSQIYKKINMRKKPDETDENLLLKHDFDFLGYKNKLNINIHDEKEIKKIERGEKNFEKWFKYVIDKNKNKIINEYNNKNKEKDINNIIYKKIIKKEEEEFKKIILKKLIRQNSSKVNNINKNKDSIFIISNEDINKKIKNRKNKSQIINEERIINNIKKKFLIDIFSYITTPQGKLNLKLILNPIEEKISINNKINSNQIKNKIILQSLIPKKYLKNPIYNPYILIEEKTKEKDSNNNYDNESDNEDNNDENDLIKNLDYIPISLKKFFLEKYKISDSSIYSKINSDIKNDLRKKKNKHNKKIIQKKLVIKVDNHNEKMINNYLNNIKNKNNKNKDNNQIHSAKKKNNKNKEINNLLIIPKKKEEKRIINIFGINISINKNKTPIQSLNDYIIKKGIKSYNELKSQIKLKNNLIKLITKLKLEKKKKKKNNNKKKYLKIFSNLLDINYNPNALIKLANKGKTSSELTSSKKLKYFDTNLIKSRKDAEKRKMQLLLKFKNDMEYKAMTGEIDETEVNMLNKLEEKINKLMDLINLNEYMEKMEDYIGEFQEEINMREKSRKDENRINGFIDKLKEDINFKNNKKNYMINRYGNAFNFNKINVINNLNMI